MSASEGQTYFFGHYLIGRVLVAKREPALLRPEVKGSNFFAGLNRDISTTPIYFSLPLPPNLQPHSYSTLFS
jgi:hypothetical protein